MSGKDIHILRPKSKTVRITAPLLLICKSYGFGFNEGIFIQSASVFASWAVLTPRVLFLIRLSIDSRAGKAFSAFSRSVVIEEHWLNRAHGNWHIHSLMAGHFRHWITVISLSVSLNFKIMVLVKNTNKSKPNKSLRITIFKMKIFFCRLGT